MHIPAFHQHQDMLQLLPGGQAYLNTEIKHLKTHTWCCCYVLYNCLSLGCPIPANQQQWAPVLSAAAVRLVLELQLLAAAEYQRWQQQQLLQQEELPAADAVNLICESTKLLHTLIRAVAQVSGSCLPPEVLQQTGLQLLQALAAPLQQLQQCSDERFQKHAQRLSSSHVPGHMGEACSVLLTAACGPSCKGMSDDDGELSECYQGCVLNLMCVQPIDISTAMTMVVVLHRPFKCWSCNFALPWSPAVPCVYKTVNSKLSEELLHYAVSITAQKSCQWQGCRVIVASHAPYTPVPSAPFLLVADVRDKQLQQLAAAHPITLHGTC
jgi:hypothetical protein